MHSGQQVTGPCGSGALYRHVLQRWCDEVHRVRHAHFWPSERRWLLRAANLTEQSGHTTRRAHSGAWPGAIPPEHCWAVRCTLLCMGDTQHIQIVLKLRGSADLQSYIHRRCVWVCVWS